MYVHTVPSLFCVTLRNRNGSMPYFLFDLLFFCLLRWSSFHGMFASHSFWLPHRVSVATLTWFYATSCLPVLLKWLHGVSQHLTGFVFTGQVGTGFMADWSVTSNRQEWKEPISAPWAPGLCSQGISYPPASRSLAHHSPVIYSLRLRC